MKKRCLIVFVAIVLISPGFSQDTTDNVEMDERDFRFHVCNFSVSSGVHKDKLTRATLKGFERLAPDSPLVNAVSDLPDYDDQSNFYYYNSMTRSLSFILGFDFPDHGIKNSAKPSLNLGLSYHSSEYKELHVRHEKTKPYDTLQSGITDNVIYLDSVTKHEFDMNYYSEQIRIDANFVYRSDPAKRFTFYAGAGINAGFSINAYSTISYEKSKYMKGSYENGSNFYSYRYFDPEVRKSENYTHKMNLGGAAYIPLGLDFRIGNKKSLWKELHLFIEARPGVNLVYIPELNIYTYGIFQGHFGIKHEW